ncbi:MAG: nitronate monooxygenase [Dehalococcoidales bacterium]|nr:nitronate monooxygenase [Dehalococcoidales bacterium]
MLKTRITEMVGIKHPVMLAGMNQVSDPGLVAAVSNAGGLGVLAVSAFTPEDTRRYIHEIKKLTDKPFGVNQALVRPLAKEKIEVAIEERVPVLCYSLGKPTFIERVHAYGGKVFGAVTTSKHAARATQLGVDCMVVTGHEAAGHGGQVTSLVLLPIISGVVKTPLIASGGFFNGKGLAAALMLGADAIWMGTRFLVSQECKVAAPFKALIVKAMEEDTFYSAAFDGMPSRILKSRAAEEYLKKRGAHVLNWLSSAMAVKRMMGLSWMEFIKASRKMSRGEERLRLFEQAQMADFSMRLQKAIDGDAENGIMPAGQSIGGIKDVPTCREIVDRIIVEAEQELDKVPKIRVS